MKIKITRINGKWTVNDKSYTETVGEERNFFDKFLDYMRRNQPKNA